jgi:hypothetical protein
MRAPKYPPAGNQCCPPALRGTIEGYVKHHQQSPAAPCAQSMDARRAYITEQTQAWAAKTPANGRERNTQAFAEDYLYLIATGETHAETIALRLGTNQVALERRLKRIGLHILHSPRPRPSQKPTRTVQRHRAKAAA